jgi:hypothetical protein
LANKESRPGRNIDRAIALIALAIASPAHAHGEDVLLSIYAQGGSIIVVLLLLFGIATLRRYWLVGLIGLNRRDGRFVEHHRQLAYTENRVRITVIDVAFPLAFTVIAVLVAYLVVRRRSGEYRRPDTHRGLSVKIALPPKWRIQCWDTQQLALRQFSCLPWPRPWPAVRRRKKRRRRWRPSPNPLLLPKRLPHCVPTTYMGSRSASSMRWRCWTATSSCRTTTRSLAWASSPKTSRRCWARMACPPTSCCSPFTRCW